MASTGQKRDTERLLNLISRFSIEDIETIEKEDRQFKALEELFRNIKDEEPFYKLILTNALLSYQLQMKGDEYWERFSEFFSREPNTERFREFLSKYNKRFLPSKLKRLEKVLRCISTLKKEDFEKFIENLKQLTDYLSSCLKQKNNSKTIVFAAKMFLYAVKIAKKKEPEGQDSIPIPIDSRLSKVSNDPEFWKEISERTGIPQIRLDALFWIALGSHEVIERLPKTLRNSVKKLQKELGSRGKNSPTS